MNFSTNSFYVAGKQAMIKGPGAFNTAASECYKRLSKIERAHFFEACRETPSNEEGITIKKVMQRGKKVFLKIQILVIPIVLETSIYVIVFCF